MLNRCLCLVMVLVAIGACGDDDGEQGVPDATFEPGIDAASAIASLPTHDLECDIAATVCVVETPGWSGVQIQL